MGSIYRASAESRSFSFEAYEVGEEAARAGLIEALENHGRQHQLDPRWWEDCLDICVEPFEIGRAYRDLSPLPALESKHIGAEPARRALFRAHVDTEHFEFEAYGWTRGAARSALLAGLRAHGEQIDPPLPSNWWRGHYDIAVDAFKIGIGYRDREPMPKVDLERDQEASGPRP